MCTAALRESSKSISRDFLFGDHPALSASHSLHLLSSRPLRNDLSAMASSAPTFVVRRTCAQLVSRTQRRSLSSQCLRITSSSSTQTCRRQQRRYQSTEAGGAPANAKIAGIVDQISTLTLLETADLVQSLKVRSLSRYYQWVHSARRPPEFKHRAHHAEHGP